MNIFYILFPKTSGFLLGSYRPAKGGAYKKFQVLIFYQNCAAFSSSHLPIDSFSFSDPLVKSTPQHDPGTTMLQGWDSALRVMCWVKPS